MPPPEMRKGAEPLRAMGISSPYQELKVLLAAR
jgi:hypothetical protein